MQGIVISSVPSGADVFTMVKSRAARLRDHAAGKTASNLCWFLKATSHIRAQFQVRDDGQSKFKRRSWCKKTVRCMGQLTQTPSVRISEVTGITTGRKPPFSRFEIPSGIHTLCHVRTATAIPERSRGQRRLAPELPPPIAEGGKACRGLCNISYHFSWNSFSTLRHANISSTLFLWDSGH